VGGKRCPLVDTWWQTETGGIMISPVPSSAHKTNLRFFAVPRIQPVLMDEKRNEEGNQVTGSFASNSRGLQLRVPFGAITSVTKTRIFYLSGKYFTGDGALRDEVGYYRTRDDVVIVSGHNLGTAPIEDAQSTNIRRWQKVPL
jgi:acetyl-CoA synthetase